MGDDAAIVQSARVSYGRGTRRISDDRGLIRYLMRHQHTTPLEMCEIKLHCKMPIFVARQWVRHRTANLNEYSARYSILDREFYIPSQETMSAQSQTNRQGRGQQLSAEEARQVQDLLIQDAMRAYDHYEEMLNEERDGRPRDPSRIGLARELARMNLSLNYYTQWYWKIDLHNLLNFLRLRADPHAQHEIRVYAQAILDLLVKPWVPLTHEAFLDYQLNAAARSKANDLPPAGGTGSRPLSMAVYAETAHDSSKPPPDVNQTHQPQPNGCKPTSAHARNDKARALLSLRKYSATKLRNQPERYLQEKPVPQNSPHKTSPSGNQYPHMFQIADGYRLTSISPRYEPGNPKGKPNGKPDI